MENPNQTAAVPQADTQTEAAHAPETATVQDDTKILGPVSQADIVEIQSDPDAWMRNRGAYKETDLHPEAAVIESGVRTRVPSDKTRTGYSNMKEVANLVIDGASEPEIDNAYAWLARYGVGHMFNKLTIALRKVNNAIELKEGDVIRTSEILAFFDVRTVEELIKLLAPWEIKGRKKASARTQQALAACAVDDQRADRLAMAEGDLAGFVKSILNTPALQLTAPEQAAQLKAYKFLVTFIANNKMKGSKPKSKIMGRLLKNLKALATMLRKAIAEAQENNVDPESLQGKIDTLETLDFLLCGGDQLSIELADFEAAAEAKRKKKLAETGGEAEATYDDLISGL